MDNIPTVSTSGQPHHSAELRIVLIGGREIRGEPSHKSITGNIILGKSVFETNRTTAQSVVGQQEVHGRKVTVVDTPGWWWHYPLENTPKLDQIEITNSVHLCDPGPHAFLLVIPVGLFFPRIFQHSLEEHLTLFQERVFKRTIVLFTAQAPSHEENLKPTCTWPALQWVLQQCGNRKHFLNINDKDSTQVMKLFEKIEAMVAENAGGYCSTDRAAGNALREEIQGMTERASKRSDEVQTQRRELRALIEGGKTPPAHLRLVMVGAHGSAKSSAGNCILGKKAFAVQAKLTTTKCCEMSHSKVAGRKLTVVDSPGWLYNHTLQDTCKRDKLEIENSMNLCPPGPHAVLLMVGLASAFNESYQRSVQEHMSLFTDDIWKHTVVVFTRGEWLGGKTVEERIESEEGLQWLVEMCGNRYHVLSNSKHSDETQVTELLEKIEEMLAGNKDPHYEVDVQRAEAIESGKEAEDKMAKRIWQITQRQSRILKEVFKGETQPVTDLRVVLVGKKESGKSMAGNTILLQELFDPHWMKKEFQHKKPTSTCVKHQRNVAGVNVTVVETPGWLTDDMMTPDWLKDEVVRGVSLCAPGPHVFLLVVPISKAFMEEDRKTVVELLKPFGETVWRYCMVLFTWSDWLNNTSIEQHIAGEGKPLQWLVEKCQNRYYVVSFYWSFTRALFHKINGLKMRNKGSCFSTGQTDKDKQKKKLKLPWQVKQPELTEEEWNRREQELIDRVLKAVLQEPSEPTQPPVKTAASMDGFCVPSMSEGAPSEYGSKFWTLRGRTMVSEWLNNRVTDSDITSGLGSISAAASYMGNLDDIPLPDESHQFTYCFPLEKDKVKFDVPLQMRVSMDTVATRRRYSL